MNQVLLDLLSEILLLEKADLMATILIVDTNPVERRAYTTLLGNFGYRLLEAGDGLGHLDPGAAAQGHPVAVISDEPWSVLRNIMGE